MGREKINLISYNVTYGDRYNNNRSDSIRIYYSVNFETKKRVKIYLSDYIFNVESQHQTIEIKQGDYWSVFHSIGTHRINNDIQITNSFIEPLRLSFVDEDTDEVINEYKLDLKFIDISLRGRNDKKNAWIIGDSHIGYISKEIKYDDLEYELIRLNPVTKVGLTMGRFANSKFLDYLSCLPIKDEDIIIFNLGEIDIRISTHIKSHNKGFNKKDIFNDILFRYLTSINKISQKYSKNKIIILRPNLPNDGGRKYSKEVINDYFLHSNKDDRKMLDNLFNETITSFCKINTNIKYIDNSSQYGIDGFIDNGLLIDNDIHMKTNKDYFDKIYNKLTDIK
jgi:hypothetical protein